MLLSKYHSFFKAIQLVCAGNKPTISDSSISLYVATTTLLTRVLDSFKLKLYVCLLSSADPSEKAMATHSSTLVWKNPMDGRAWWATVHGVSKSWTRLSDFTFTFHFHALEKEMATHSSILAWRIPGTVEPGGLPSMGSHRVGHNWSDLAAAGAADSSVVVSSFSQLIYIETSLVCF